jgi:hypothetical protein
VRDAVRPSLLDNFLWISSTLLQLAVLVQIRRRGIAGKYKALTAYLIFWLSEFLLAYLLLFFAFYKAYYFLYWGATAVSAVLSLLIVVELIIHKLQADVVALPRSLLLSGTLLCSLILIGTDFTRVPTAIILNVNFQARIVEAAILAVFFTLCASKHHTSGLDFDIGFGLSVIVSTELMEHFIGGLYPAAERLGNYAIVLASIFASAVWLRGALLHPEFCEVNLTEVLQAEEEAQADECKQEGEEEAQARVHNSKDGTELQPQNRSGTRVPTSIEEAQSRQIERRKPRRTKRKKIGTHIEQPEPQHFPAAVSPFSAPQPTKTELPASEQASPFELAPPSRGQTAAVIKERYTIKGLLGVGSYGMVYKAYDNDAARYVVLKFVADAVKDDPRMLKRFRREAIIASRLKHKNICPVYGLIETQVNTAIVMEFVSGKNLERFVFPNRQAAEIAALIPIFSEIADGLSYSHSAGVIHRDVKPSNIMFSRAGLVKIVDFGIAKSTLGDLSSTSGDEVKGALAYAAPELLQGQAATVQSDIYSFGCLMYTLATGEHPFLAQSRKIGWEQAILENSPKRPTWLNSKIPQELEKIVLRAMSRDRAQRYSSVMNIWVELQSLVSKPVAEVKKPKRRRAA